MDVDGNFQKENNTSKNDQIVKNHVIIFIIFSFKKPQRNRKFGNKKTERLLYSINKQLIEIHNISHVLFYSQLLYKKQIDEEFHREIKDQKDDMNKIIEDFKIILASNKINFDFESKLSNQQQIFKDQISENEKVKSKIIPVFNENMNQAENINEINYPVNLKSLNSNRNLEILSKEMNKKLETSENEIKNNTTSQNLSQRVTNLIQENKEKKNTKTINGKFVSKN